MMNNEQILLKKAKKEKNEDRVIVTEKITDKVSLAILFNEYEGDNLAKDFNWDEAVEKEIW